MSNLEDSGQNAVLTPKPTSSRSFRKAFGLGAVWWIVVSTVAVAHNPTRRPGIIFGELLGPSLIAAVVSGTVGRLVRTRRTWLLVVAIFLFVWFAVRLTIVVNRMVTGQ
jgi:hypothetical protein